MKSFKVSVDNHRATEDQEHLTFQFEGDEFVYSVKKHLKQDTLLLSSSLITRGGRNSLVEFTKLLERIFEKESADRLMSRILDEENNGDPLRISDLAPVIQWVIEELGGRPTGPQSA